VANGFLVVIVVLDSLESDCDWFVCVVSFVIDLWWFFVDVSFVIDCFDLCWLFVCVVRCVMVVCGTLSV
jgi:hypothetical protein